MSLDALNKRLDDLGELIVQERKANDEKIKSIAETGRVAPELTEKLEKMSARYDSIDADIERLEKAIAESKVPAANDSRYKDGTEVQMAHKAAFMDYLRNPTSGEAQDKLMNAQKAAHEEQLSQRGRKAVTIGDNAAGGHAVPEIISTRINEKIVEMSSIRDLVTVVQAGSSDYKELVDVGGEEYGWVGESDTRSETGTAQLEEVAPTFGTVYAYPKASEESMQDIFFDVDSWLINRSARGLSRGAGIAIISGDGTKKPTGFLAGTPVTTGDEDSPARAFGTLQYVASGAAADFVNDQTGSPPGNPGDVIMDCNALLKTGYKNNAVWLMNRTTQSRIRKFKDANGNYLFERSLQMGVPSMLDGYAIREMPDMPDIGANAFPIAFGNFEEAYVFVELAGLRITRDEITTPGFVKFYVRQRVGGKVKNDDAIKLIKIAAS
jgi:HK97 family phage major capsid protein